jgi:uroporphyrinogen decarboxylase
MWFHPDVTQRLAGILELPPSRVPDALGDDVRQTWVGNNQAMEGVIHEHEGETHTDVWGIEWVREGAFNQVRRSPLAEADDAGVLKYRFPLAHIEALFAPMDRMAAQAGEHFLGCDISPCLLELLFRIRGMEQTLLDLAANPRLTETLLHNAASFAVLLAEKACTRYSLDWLWTGDDVGGQRAMIVSPRQWREMIKPHLARIFQVGKTRGLPVAYHSCGAIRPIIPDLIDIGLDVLNPVQCNCPGMDPCTLKKEFGTQISFMGGVDTQELLPRGTRAEVFRATAQLIEGMTSDGGGYILAASHSIPPETPTENIFALYAAAGISSEEIFDRASRLRTSLRAAATSDFTRGLPKP